MTAATAGKNQIRYLYNYQRYKSDRLERLLASNCIYLSDTKGFNDPWDCRPYFDVSQLNDPMFRQRQVQWFERVDRKQNQHLSDGEHRIRSERLNSDTAFLEWCIRETIQLEAEIQKRYRVYCLTTKPADILMWSHYAENHTGICLEFGCDNGVLSSALQVVYCEAYPSLDLADDDSQTVLLPLVAKAKDWAYEDEYRLIAQEDSAALNRDSLITRDNMLLLPDRALVSIIVGCVAPEGTRDTIRTIIQRSGRNIGLKQAVRVPNRYELIIEDLT